ncbi:MAG: KOW domain-containing RNA-binding protein [Oscillospiraceae bacterium]|nr:KOW domain-containing RNA-binding protein [Oscillospiraceae bacterium]
MKRPMPYDIVASLAGHDEGKLFMVVGCQADRLLLCDGKGRPMAGPKQKSPKHVRLIRQSSTPPTTDKDIRTTLAQAVSQTAAKEGELLGER